LDVDSILRKAEGEATPTPRRSREVAAAVEEVDGMLKKAAQGARVQPTVQVGGSYAHGTWLEAQTDVDFFLIYPKEVDRERFEEMGLSLAKDALAACSPRTRYAEHPYIEADAGSVTVNAVPCYDVAKGEWKSAADRSPFHTRYMNEHLIGSLKAQTRVLKLFMKAQGLYGAEIRVRGFSGYACEVLTLKYGSFLGVARGALTWKRGTVVSVEGGEELAKALFKDSPIALLDPVDTTRNLGLAISPMKLATFVLLARKFIEEPSIAYFHSNRLRSPKATPVYLKEQTLLLGFPIEEKSEDILWGELWKSANAIAAHLTKDGVNVIRRSVAADKGWASIALLVSPVKLPKAQVRNGPEALMGDATSRFLAASKGRADAWWIGDDMRCHAIFEGETSDGGELLDRYFRDPVASVGFAKGLAKAAKQGHIVRAGARAYASRRPADRQALAELVGYSF